MRTYQCRLYAMGREVVPGKPDYREVWDTVEEPMSSGLPQGEPAETFTGSTTAEIRQQIAAFRRRTGAMTGSWNLRGSF